MIITPQAISNLFTGLKKHFQDGQSKAEPQYTKVATVVPSTTKSNTYGWLGKFPGLKKWIGDRDLKNMKAHSYSVTNEKFESSVVVSKDDIEDDEIGIYAPLAQEAGRASEVHPDELVFPLLKNGFVEICYDGQPFFDDEHPVTAEADGTGAVVATTNMLVDGAYTGDAWYLLDTTRAIKPLIFQQRKKPEFIQMTDSKDEAVFMRDEYRFGVDCRDNAGFGFWQMAFGAKADLTYENLWAAYTAMRSFKSDGGRPLGIRPVMLVVPVSLEQKAIKLIDREKLANGESNELYKKFEIIVPDYL
jgi:phage major head subunit gpT-like protein